MDSPVTCVPCILPITSQLDSRRIRSPSWTKILDLRVRTDSQNNSRWGHTLLNLSWTSRSPPLLFGSSRALACDFACLIVSGRGNKNTALCFYWQVSHVQPDTKNTPFKRESSRTPLSDQLIRVIDYLSSLPLIYLWLQDMYVVNKGEASLNLHSLVPSVAIVLLRFAHLHPPVLRSPFQASSAPAEMHPPLLESRRLAQSCTRLSGELDWFDPSRGFVECCRGPEVSASHWDHQLQTRIYPCYWTLSMILSSMRLGWHSVLTIADTVGWGAGLGLGEFVSSRHVSLFKFYR